MKLLLLIPVLVFFSCGGGAGKKNDTGTVTDTGQAAEKVTTPPPPPTPPVQTPGAAAFEEVLHARYPGSWHVLNDAEATWMKDAFDYFILPKRKENPDYPYITTGDFNGDGTPDRAALITDSSKRNYQLAIILDTVVLTWKEDIIEDAALSAVPRSVITGMDGEKEKKVAMKGDGIRVEYFEKASFVLYWDKKGFRRLQTGD